MKKVLICVLALAMLASMAACAAGTGESAAASREASASGEAASSAPDGGSAAASGDSAAPDGGSAGPAAAEPTAPTCAAAVRFTETGEDVTDGDTLLLRYSLYEAEVTVEGSAAAAAAATGAIKAYNQLFEAGKAEDASLAAEARAAMGADWRNYARQRTCGVARLDSRTLSVVFTDYFDYGGAHPSTLVTAKNYALTDGAELTLASVAEKPTDFLSFAVEYVTKLAAAETGAGSFFEGYQADIAGFVADDYWYFSDEGMAFICNADVIAPHAAGMMIFTIPYSELDGYLKDAYFPAAGAAASSAANVSAAAKAAAGRAEGDGYFTVAPDKDGEKTCIWFDGAVTNLRLQAVREGAEAGLLTPAYTLFAADAFSPANTLEVDAAIPEGTPNLMLTYTQGDGVTVNRLLTWNGQNGSPALTEQKTN